MSLGGPRKAIYISIISDRLTADAKMVSQVIIEHWNQD